jgi:hypothetical protein
LENGLTPTEQIAHYRKEIARRSPPRNRHDRFMIEVYRYLLRKSTNGHTQPGYSGSS